MRRRRALVVSIAGFVFLTGTAVGISRATGNRPPTDPVLHSLQCEGDTGKRVAAAPPHVVRRTISVPGQREVTLDAALARFLGGDRAGGPSRETTHQVVRQDEASATITISRNGRRVVLLDFERVEGFGWRRSSYLACPEWAEERDPLLSGNSNR